MYLPTCVVAMFPKVKMSRGSSHSIYPSLDEEELSEGEDLGRARLLVRVADGLVEGVGGVVAARGSDPLEEINRAIHVFSSQLQLYPFENRIPRLSMKSERKMF